MFTTASTATTTTTAPLFYSLLLLTSFCFILLLLLLAEPVFAVLAVFSTEDDTSTYTCGLLDNGSNNDNNNNDWLDPFSYYLHDTTPHDVGLVLLVLSSLRRLLNDTVHAWIVPLYTLNVMGYLLILYLKRFWKRCRQRSIQRNQQKKRRSGSLIQPAESTQLLREEEIYYDHRHQPINLSGLYKLIRIENLDAFLAAQGVPWPLRKAASKVMPLHEITHRLNQITIRIDAGPIQTSTTYQIGCGSVETEVRGRIFRDNVNYLKDTVTGKVVGVVNEKTAVTEGYQVTVSRRLSDDMKHIYMESIASFPNDPTKEQIISTQLFERVER